MGSIQILEKPKLEEKRSASFKDVTRRPSKLKEVQAKKYSFLNSDLLGMLDDLLEKEIIQLLEAKRPEEVQA